MGNNGKCVQNACKFMGKGQEEKEPLGKKKV
jgi:hypothetical protein